MDSITKKSIKLTNANQFNALVGCMEEFPHLATGCPIFGSSRAAVEQTWETVANKVNARGPPYRTGVEWKKIWADLKSRLKKKIAENNKFLHETGGGPCRVSNLTDLENDIERICNLSTAAAPSGKVFGISKTAKKLEVSSTYQQNLFETTPPRRQNKVAVVTPTNLNTLQGQSAIICTTTAPEQSQQMLASQQKPTITATTKNTPITSTPKQHQRVSKVPNTEPIRQRKRKHNDSSPEKHERMKLLKQQVDIQNQTLDAINRQAKAAEKQAEASMMQAEASKMQAEAVIEAGKAQTESHKVVAESMKLMTKAIYDIVRHVIEENPQIL